MKKNLLKKSILFIVIIFCFSFILASFYPFQTAKAEDNQLPNPGISPDSFWYFAEIIKERVVLIFTFNKSAKIDKYLDLADERISEAKEMSRQEKARETITALDEYISLVKRARSTVKVLSDKQVGKAKDKIHKKVKNHIYHFESIRGSNVDPMVREKIKKAKTYSHKLRGEINSR